MLQIYNTLNRRKEPFKPLKAGHVGLYVCGITVYDECHVGHGRVMIVYDVLFRHLQSAGYLVNYVRNITDVDDKIIKRAAEQNVTPGQLSQRYIEKMHADERALNVLPPVHEPRATESIKSMVRIIGQLIESGHAYAADNGDVFYSVKSFAEYGKLSGRKVDELRAGERVAVDEYKRDPLDFVLWKSSKPGEPSWPSPWGDGRPGWHIECSAMSMDLLGEEFDIHGGGADLQFPHHENEIAQSEALTGGRFARYWMHNGLVRIGDEKMSKSLNNFMTIGDVLAHYSGEEIRTFIIGSHYRSPLNYTTEALLAARTALRRFYTALRGRPVDREALTQASTAVDTTALDAGYLERFEAAMDDDLNTPEALAVLHELANSLNKEADLESAVSRKLASTLVYLGGRLGVLDKDPEVMLQGEASEDGPSAAQIDTLIKERQAARAAKDFSRSDQIRDELAAQGVVLEDAGGKTTWRRD
ncbi:cysteine--tRNA ligase [Granulosicoccus antarcticus]|uniref:Cysteine--tRNA ligase n=1 Tax=Granulosicoccus antarcticus IMCC3135 TaxID=1192854 RepID=A0A2Z2NSC1_9GAMM|nr:cysteine--tRNA ligase [Granulosicoccus antarcticus]ASJ74446.1 Cysteine--tRNA ligase [Granulosicoccus antarcticus IMCC3135]